MAKSNEWLFEVIMELSDKSQAAGLPAVAAKLEDVLDTYLEESKQIEIRLDAREKLMEIHQRQLLSETAKDERRLKVEALSAQFWGDKRPVSRSRSPRRIGNPVAS